MLTGMTNLLAGRTGDELDPPYLFPDYASTVLRSPSRALVLPPSGTVELTGPRFGSGDVAASDADLTLHGSREAIGERIIVHGRVTDGEGRPVRRTLPVPVGATSLRGASASATGIW